MLHWKMLKTKGFQLLSGSRVSAYNDTLLVSSFYFS